MSQPSASGGSPAIEFFGEPTPEVNELGYFNLRYSPSTATGHRPRLMLPPRASRLITAPITTNRRIMLLNTIEQARHSVLLGATIIDAHAPITFALFNGGLEPWYVGAGDVIAILVPFGGGPR